MLPSLVRYESCASDVMTSSKLREYRRKRDFDHSPEPEGSGVASTTQQPIFVVQEHHASRLHYDFRLEVDGVLKSWALPHEPEQVVGLRRLAVQTEDHPLEYATFEGEIPAPGYGAGHVEIWDRGTWKPEKSAAKALSQGELSFDLFGTKLTGRWTLVRFGQRDPHSAKQKNWLLIKRSDARASDLKHLSVDRASSRSLSDPSELANARKAAFPSLNSVQLAVSVESPPEGSDWLHEPKLDGYRLLAEIRDGHVRLRTRNHLDWTARFTGIAAGFSELPCATALVDGETVVFDSRGISDFSRLQRALADGEQTMTFVAFDLPYLDGWDLREAPLIERKHLLQTLLIRSQPVIRYGDHLIGDGAAFFQQACEIGLEGVVSKRADEPYREERSGDWRKVKCRLQQEFVIVGFTDGKGSNHGLGALLMAVHETPDQPLRYIGRVGTGFDQRTRHDLTRRLRALERDEPPLRETPAGQNGRHVHWVEPALVAEVEFAGWTADKLLRHASFRGLREDKPAGDVTMEKQSRPSSRKRSKSNVTVSHPEKALFPGEPLTKQELVDHWIAVASLALPWIARRPLSLLRCPEGIDEECFYQKHIAEGFPDAVLRIQVDEDGDPYAMVDDHDGLIGLVQMNVIEVHNWGSVSPRIDQPDMLVFDLDPAEEITWSLVVESAFEMKSRLEELGLTPFAKVTGGKGIHVVVPVKSGPTWPAVKAFTKTVAKEMESENPDRYTTNMSKAKRKGKIFIDYLRNDREATSIAPFSPRAREGAPVALPVEWDDLDAFRDKRLRVTVKELPNWLASHKTDLWPAFDAARTSLSG